MSDLAATLAEDNISLRRPSPDTDFAQRNVEIVGVYTVKSHGNATRSKEYHKKCHLEEDKEMKQAVGDDNLQLVDSNGAGSCPKETVSESLKASKGGIATPMGRTTPLEAPSVGGNSDQDLTEVMGLYDSAKLPAENSHNTEKTVSSPNVKFQPFKSSPDHPMPWWNSDQVVIEATGFYEGDSAQMPEENSHKTEKSASSPREKFQPLKPAPEQSMLWDNSNKEVDEATGFYKDISTTLPRKNAFSPKSKLRSLKPSPELLEFADIKTNATYIVDGFEKRHELVVDKTVVSRNRKEFEPLKPCLKHHDFAELKTNGAFIVDDFENMYKLDAIENGVSSKKTSGMELLGQGGDDNSQTEICHAVDMEVSSDDQASPDEIHARNEFTGSRNTGKGSVSNTRKDDCITKEAIPDLISTEQKTFKVEEFSGTDSVLHHAKPSISSTEVGQVSIDTLKQGAYNTKHKGSEVENTSINSNGSCLLYTEPSIYTVDIKEDREDTLAQESNNIKNCRSVNSRKRTTCAAKKEDLNAIYTEQELSNCNSDELVKESHGVDHFDSDPQGVSNKKNASVDVNSQGKIVHVLNEALNDTNCQDKMILKIDKEGYAKFTQEEVCHDSTVTEGCNMEDGIINSTEHQFNAVKGIDNVQARDDKRQDTGREINNISVFSDKHQRRNNNKEEDENETNSNTEWSSSKCVEAVATHRDRKSCDEKSIDVMHNKKGTSDAYKIGTKETNAGDTSALNTEGGVCEIENNDSISCLSNAKSEKNIDCDITMAKGQKCDNGELKIYNMGEVFVTQPKRYFSKDVYPSGNRRQESDSYVTQQEMHLSKELIPGHVMKELSETNVSSDGLKPQQMFDTDCPRFSVSFPEEGNYSKISKVDRGIAKRRCCSWPCVKPYQSNAADNNKFVTSSPNTCKAVDRLQKTKDFVPASFEHIDMEISSDEERQPRLTNSAVRVVDGENDASKPYSPSSPTRKSEEHCSPHAKEDHSPYSPSHPTNVSEGDVEQSDPVKELRYDDKDDNGGASSCEAKEKIIAGGCALNNSLKCREARKNESKANSTVLKQANNSDSNSGVTSVNSFTLSSSPKSKSGPFLRVSLAEVSVDMNMPVDNATQCRSEKANSKYNKSGGKGGAACVVDLTTDYNGEDIQKPSMRCPKRTQSLPIFSPVVPRPNVMYVTATKTKHAHTDRDFQDKPRIFYATNDRISKPVNSFSQDVMPSKNRIFGESSSYDSKNIKGPIAFETRQSSERKTVREVNPVMTKLSGNSDASLKLENNVTQGSDLDTGKGSTPLKNAKTNNVLMVSAIKGCGHFTGSMASIDKEKVGLSNTSIAQQDLGEKCSRATLKDKDTASGDAHFVQDTFCKDTGADDKAENLLTTKTGTEIAAFKVISTSYSVASGEVHNSLDKVITYSSKNCSGTPSTSIDDISSFGSVPEKQQSLVPKELRERTSLRSFSTRFRVEGSMTEVPSNCNHKVPKGINRDTNCGSVETPVTCEMIAKRPLTSTCEMTTYGQDNNQTPLLGTYERVESTVLEGEVGNRKDEIDEESLSNVPKQRVRTVHTLPTSFSRSGHKRSHPDLREGSHPCKVLKKPLKLIIPSHQVLNDGAKGAAKTGVNASEISSCTVTRADLHFVLGSNGEPISELDNGANKDVVDNASDDVMTITTNQITSLNTRRTAKPCAKNSRKTGSCTITSADLDFVSGNNSLPVHENDMLTVDRPGIVNSELLSPSNRIAEIESSSRSQVDSWHSTTGYTSPLSRHVALHNQHNETSHSSVENVRIEEHREKGVLTEGEASFVGKKSDWVDFKMERLRKKKEEIERVNRLLETIFALNQWLDVLCNIL